MIHIDPALIGPGEHVIILESFDESSINEATLYTDTITIYVAASVCIVEKIWFEPAQLQIVYPIGKKSMNFSLPEIKQSPDCRKKFTNIDIVSSNIPDRINKSWPVSLKPQIGSQRVAELVKIDASSNSIQVNAHDEADFLDGELFFMQIAVKDSTQARSAKLFVSLTFIDYAASTILDEKKSAVEELGAISDGIQNFFDIKYAVSFCQVW